ASHDHLAEWVKNGGALIYCGRDKDPFQNVQEWWNSNGNQFNAPSEDLFLKLGLKKPFSTGEYQSGKGKVVIMRNDPKEFVLQENGDAGYVNTIKGLYQRVNNQELEFKNYFSLTRGPYEIISVVDENPDHSSFTIKGKFID